MEEKASLGHGNVPTVFAESCKQHETRHSTLNTSYCFSKQKVNFSYPGQFGKLVLGSFFQDNAQHNAAEPGGTGGEKWGEGKGEANPDLALVTKHLTCPA